MCVYFRYYYWCMYVYIYIYIYIHIPRRRDVSAGRGGGAAQTASVQTRHPSPRASARNNFRPPKRESEKGGSYYPNSRSEISFEPLKSYISFRIPLLGSHLGIGGRRKKRRALARASVWVTRLRAALSAWVRLVEVPFASECECVARLVGILGTMWGMTLRWRGETTLLTHVCVGSKTVWRWAS